MVSAEIYGDIFILIVSFSCVASYPLYAYVDYQSAQWKLLQTFEHNCGLIHNESVFFVFVLILHFGWVFVHVNNVGGGFYF